MIAIGSDHGGFDLKEEIRGYLEENGIAYKDFGCFSPESIDYADVAYPVAKAVAAGEYEKGILCCGTGIGISIAANKVKGIRAACCSDCFSAKLTRQHNDANILCMGGRVVGAGLALMMVDLFLNTTFEGGRHQTRIDKIARIEEE
ncbi:MAG: ribose 5-phosphate isomerase B [Lachnospiraceae bacterium]|jgi:ribose 5-phosphate isomerase B|nr:ribose 5-phosphate isomerase B [Lachnospiraceae bacterium]